MVIQDLQEAILDQLAIYTNHEGDNTRRSLFVTLMHIFEKIEEEYKEYISTALILALNNNTDLLKEYYETLLESGIDIRDNVRALIDEVEKVLSGDLITLDNISFNLIEWVGIDKLFIIITITEGE